MKKIFILAFMLFFLTACEFDIRNLVNEIEEITSAYEKSNYSDDSFYMDNLSILNGNMPKKGKIRPLIIPIMFEDGNDTSKYSTNNISSIFFSNELEWESLNSYYTKSSYNLLSFDGKPYEYQTLENKKSYYLSYEQSDYYKSTDIILQEVINNIDVSLEDYDSNNDNIVDAVYLVYNTTNEEPFNSRYNEISFKVGDYKIEQYVALNVSDMYTNNYLDASILIQNTGYMLGIDKYLDDSTKGANTGLGQFDIMTGSLTDHNSYSKMMMGWVKPNVVIRGERYYTLKPFNNNGDMLILNASYNEELGIYDEYFIIDYFSNESINRITALSPTGGGYANSELENGKIIYKENKGVRIYHVNSTRKDDKLLFNNQTTSNSLLSLIKGNSLLSSTYEGDSNGLLLTEGDVFNSSSINSGELVNVYNQKWIVSIESINDNECLLKITYVE